MDKRGAVTVWLVLALLTFGAFPAFAGAAGGRGPASGGEVEVVPGEVLVRYAPGHAHKAAARAGGALRTLGRAGGLDRVAVEGDDPAAAAAELMRTGAATYAQPNYIYRVSATNDPAWPDLWGLDNRGQSIRGVSGTTDVDLDVPAAWNETRGSSSILVAVIDTGTDIGHPDLAANIWVNTKEKNGLPGVDDDGNGFVDDVNGWDFVNNDASVFDSEAEDAHGTHVAGTIAGIADNSRGIAGVAPRVRILPIKAIGSGGGTTAQVVAAVEYAAAMGADVINASFGGRTSSPDTALSDAIAASGAVFVAAAGNGGDDEIGDDNDTMLISPAGLSATNIVSVAAVDNRGRLPAFSNYGDSTVDLGAPGVSIVSTYPGNQYVWMDGTSMAAPHVSGVAALVASKHTGLPVADTVKALLASATANPLSSLAGKTVTGGMVNAADALALAAEGGGTPIGEEPAPDGTAPVWPDGAAISVGLVTTDGFKLSWPSASDDVGVTGYDVTVGSLAPVRVTGTSHSATGLLAATTYPVSVEAVDAAGNVSAELTGSVTTAPTTTSSTPPYDGDGPRTLEWACPEHVSAGWTDVPLTSPHLEGIDCATAWAVFLGGETDGTFVPGGKLSRAQLASVLARAIEQATGQTLPAGTDQFIDDESSPHEASINKLAALGIVGGYDGGLYKPAAQVSRAQFATMLAATYEHLVGTLPVGTDAFDDDDASPHEPNIDAMAALGVVGGVAVGEYDPAGVLTRAQSATMVARLIDALVEAGAAG